MYAVWCPTGGQWPTQQVSAVPVFSTCPTPSEPEGCSPTRSGHKEHRSLTSDSAQVRVREVETLNKDASTGGWQTKARRRSPLLALASCLSLSALLLIVGTPPLSLLAAPVGVVGALVSLARIRSASSEQRSQNRDHGCRHRCGCLCAVAHCHSQHPSNLKSKIVSPSRRSTLIPPCPNGSLGQ